MTNQPTQTGADRPVDMIIFGGGGEPPASCCPRCTWRTCTATFRPRRASSRSAAATGASTAIASSWTSSRVRSSTKGVRSSGLEPFLDLFKYVLIDVNAPDDYLRLAEAARGDAIRVFYLSTSPELFTTICDNLSAAHLVDKHSRVVLEKPLGHDLASAKAINDAVGKHFEESQIYRIDHYLGRNRAEPDGAALRQPIFGPLWQAPSIRSVQITVAETVGVGSRAGFYDHTGALRDMVQNHLLQLLCIVAMEPPVSLDPDAVRDEKLKVLRSLRPMAVADVARDTVRGQVHGRRGRRPAGEGLSRGRQRAGRQPRGNLRRAARAHQQLALGQRAVLPAHRQAAAAPPVGNRDRVRGHAVLDHPDRPRHYSNRLVIQLQPEESIQLQMLAKEPGSGMNMVPVSLNLDLQQAIPERRAEAYERLLIDVIRGRLTHFMRRDELEAAWSWVEPILDGWKQLGDRPRLYTAGTFGPAASSALLARDGMSYPKRRNRHRRRAGVRHAGSHAKSHGA